MPVINVAKRFLLQLVSDGPIVEYLPGQYEVTEEVAEHWFVKPHLVGAVIQSHPAVPVAQTTLLVEQAVRMSESVSSQAPGLPDAPPGTVPAKKEEVFFAGTPQSEEAKRSTLSLARGPTK
jgi:hypothetical protein